MLLTNLPLANPPQMILVHAAISHNNPSEANFWSRRCFAVLRIHFSLNISAGSVLFGLTFSIENALGTDQGFVVRNPNLTVPLEIVAAFEKSTITRSITE